MTDDEIKTISFSHNGLRYDFVEIASEIARSADSEKEAWSLVDKLDDATKNSIYEQGSFTEQ